MSLASLSSTQLRRLIELVKEKETLQARLAEIDQSLAMLENDRTPSQKGSAKARAPRRPRRHGGLKNALLKELRAAGKEGMTVKGLADRLNAKLGSVSVWFYTTGKKIKEIQKVGKARFAYVE
jgi:hypothetical protein